MKFWLWSHQIGYISFSIVLFIICQIISFRLLQLKPLRRYNDLFDRRIFLVLLFKNPVTHLIFKIHPYPVDFYSMNQGIRNVDVVKRTTLHIDRYYLHIVYIYTVYTHVYKCCYNLYKCIDDVTKKFCVLNLYCYFSWCTE